MMRVEYFMGAFPEGLRGVYMSLFNETHIEIFEIHCGQSQCVYPFPPPKYYIITNYIYEKQMGFELTVSHMEFDIFTYAPTFHHTSIGNHDMSVVHPLQKTMGLFCHFLVNQILSISIVNQAYNFLVLDVAHEFQDLWS